MAGILIIRHAEPEVRGTLLGQADPPLSEAGRRQALRLREVEVATVVTSPLLRARETAAVWRREALVEDGLREWSYGAWDGMTWESIVARYPREARRREADWFGYTMPGQESWAEFTARVEGAWRRIEVLPRPVAIVAHQAVNSVLWRILQGGAEVNFRQAYCEILEA